MNTDWADLLGAVRDAVQDRAGKVTAVHPVSGGNYSDFTAVLEGECGPVFAKGARLEPDRQDIRTLRWEAAVAPHVAGLAPRLLWSVQAGGWLVLRFEYVADRHLDYSPGSPDLDLLAGVLARLQQTACPPVVERRVEQRWERLASAGELDVVRGWALLHCDLNPGNLLVAPGGVRLVDWAFACRGAAWAERVPAWRAAPPSHIDALARLLAEQWRRRRRADDTGWVAELAGLTARWEGYRRRTPGVRGRLTPLARHDDAVGPARQGGGRCGRGRWLRPAQPGELGRLFLISRALSRWERLRRRAGG